MRGALALKPAAEPEHDVSTAQRTREGDRVKTSARSLADISVAGFARMRLGPQTTVRVLRTNGGLTLDLAQGGVCAVATAGQAGVTSGLTLTSATAPAIFSMARNRAGAVLAVYRGDVRTSSGLVAHAGQAYALAPGAAETRLPLSSVKADFAPLECPDAAVIAAAEALEAPPQQPIAPRHGGPESASAGGRGGILGAAAGLGLVAALTAEKSGGGFARSRRGDHGRKQAGRGLERSAPNRP